VGAGEHRDVGGVLDEVREVVHEGGRGREPDLFDGPLDGDRVGEVVGVFGCAGEVDQFAEAGSDEPGMASAASASRFLR